MTVPRMLVFQMLFRSEEAFHLTYYIWTTMPWVLGFGFWVLSSGKVKSRKCKDIKTCSTDDVLFDPLDVCLELPARVLWYVDLLVDVHSKILGS